MRRVYPANDNPRCPTCGTHPHLCVCADLPVHAVRTRFVFVQHTQEACKPTNSARLACRMLDQASIVPWSRPAPPRFPEDSILLYPLPDATELRPSELTAGVTIVVPDGTWNQASKIASVLGRFPLRRRILPMGDVSTWGVRQASAPDRISSAQAVAMVLDLAGDHKAATGLASVLSEVGRRILSMRGIVREAAPLSDFQQATDSH